MPRPDVPDDRDAAWSAAKAAVRAYARDPSDRNAENVRAAWLRVRRQSERAIRRRMVPPEVSRGRAKT